MLPLRLRRSKDTYALIEQDAERVVCAIAQRNCCLLIFEDGKEFRRGYPLKHFEELVACTGKFLRVHRCYLVRKDAITDCGWLFLLLNNGARIPVGAKMNFIVKEIVKKLQVGKLKSQES